MSVVATRIDNVPQTEEGTTRRQRIPSIDIIRGMIMVLMAIDHVRVYADMPAGGPTPGIFFTRCVTHFCAPGFVFLAGTAAYLHGRKLGNVHRSAETSSEASCTWWTVTAALGDDDVALVIPMNPHNGLAFVPLE